MQLIASVLIAVALLPSFTACWHWAVQSQHKAQMKKVDYTVIACRLMSVQFQQFIIADSALQMQAHHARLAHGGLPRLLHCAGFHPKCGWVKPVTCWRLHLWLVSGLPVSAQLAQREVGGCIASCWSGRRYWRLCWSALLLLQEGVACNHCKWQL